MFIYDSDNIAGVFLYSRTFGSIKKNDITSPGITYWFMLLVLVESITSTLILNLEAILSMVIIAGIIIMVFYKKGVEIRKLVSVVSVIAFTIVITNSANYTLSKPEYIDVKVVNKYELRTHVPGTSSTGYVLDVRKEGDSTASVMSVDVREDTYHSVEIGENIELLERTSILNHSLADPKIDSARVLDNWMVVKFKYADYIVIIIGLTFGLLLSYISICRM